MLHNIGSDAFRRPRSGLFLQVFDDDQSDDEETMTITNSPLHDDTTPLLASNKKEFDRQNSTQTTDEPVAAAPKDVAVSVNKLGNIFLRIV
jgi:hypothetical protein